MLGVADLKITLGLPVRNPDGRVDESMFYEAISKMIATSKQTGIQLMMPAFRMKPEDVELLKNFKLLMTSVDVLSILKSHQKDLIEAKKALGVPNGTANGKFTGVPKEVTSRIANAVPSGTLKGY